MDSKSVKMVAIDSVAPHPLNYNQHTPKQIAELVESLNTYGQQKNIVVWNGLIIAGNGLWTAAKKAGVKKIGVVDISDQSEEFALGYMVADNETARMSKADMALLGELINQSPMNWAEVPGMTEEFLGRIATAVQRGAPPPLLFSGEERLASVSAGADHVEVEAAGVMYEAPVVTEQSFQKVDASSHIRLFQLFYQIPDYEDMLELLELAKERYDVSSGAEAIHLALKELLR